MKTSQSPGIAAALACAALAAACGDDEGGGTARSRPDPAASNEGEDAVALVDGEPIRLRDVRTLIEAVDGGLAPEEALEALVRQHLLAKEAKRRGWSTASEVLDAERTALARAFLTREVDGMGPADVNDDDLEAVYEKNLDIFVHGPSRRVAHALVTRGKADKASARDLAERIAAAAAGARSAEEFERIASDFGEGSACKVKVEEVPPFSRESKRFVRPFVEAVFSAPGVGRATGAFRTRYGWHVAYVIEELPAKDRSFEDVRDELARDFLPAAKRARAKEIIDGLYGAADVILLEENAPADAGDLP